MTDFDRAIELYNEYDEWADTIPPERVPYDDPADEEEYQRDQCDIPEDYDPAAEDEED